MSILPVLVNQPEGGGRDAARLVSDNALVLSDLILQTGFLGQLLDEYNRKRGQPKGSPAEKSHLVGWLTSRANEADEVDGLSVLECEILRHRSDVHIFVLEDGIINVSRLRQWAITHGAHELGLDHEMLADTIEHVLSLGVCSTIST